MPLMRTRVYSEPRPRTVIWRPSPLMREIDTPGMRCNDSARFRSGNWAMSSALMASTTPLELRLMFIALCRLARKPVTTTASTSSAPDWAGAGVS